jgi:hypothetical protein
MATWHAPTTVNALEAKDADAPFGSFLAARLGLVAS